MNNNTTETPKAKRYDPGCGDLARQFLPDKGSEGSVELLAQHIQDSIEMWLYDQEERGYPKP